MSSIKSVDGTELKKNVQASLEGSVAQTASLSDVVNFAYQPQENREPVVLFSKDKVEDPCSLLGQSVTVVANRLLTGDKASLFVVGAGPCPQCSKPMVFYNENGAWKQVQAPRISQSLSAVEGYAEPKGLKHAYHLLADGDLKITDVVHVVGLNAKGQMVMSDGCKRSLEQTVEKNLAETSSMWWVWLIILVLIILLIYFLVSKKKY